MLTTDQARVLIESIDTSTLVGLRDRALIGVMTYAFARIGAVVSMRVEDYFANGKRWWVRLHEKAASDMRCRPTTSSKLSSTNTSALPASPATKRAPVPVGRPSHRHARGHGDAPVDAWRMIQRRSAELGLKVKIGCHTFRATGIMAYLEAGGTLENAQLMAAYESPRTTKLYDRTGDEITLDEVERITI